MVIRLKDEKLEGIKKLGSFDEFKDITILHKKIKQDVEDMELKEKSPWLWKRKQKEKKSQK